MITSQQLDAFRTAAEDIQIAGEAAPPEAVNRLVTLKWWFIEQAEAIKREQERGTY